MNENPYELDQELFEKKADEEEKKEERGRDDLFEDLDFSDPQEVFSFFRSVGKALR